MSTSVSDAAAKLAKARWKKHQNTATDAHAAAAQRNGLLGGRPVGSVLHCPKCKERCKTSREAKSHCA